MGIVEYRTWEDEWEWLHGSRNGNGVFVSISTRITLKPHIPIKSGEIVSVSIEGSYQFAIHVVEDLQGYNRVLIDTGWKNTGSYTFTAPDKAVGMYLIVAKRDGTAFDFSQLRSILDVARPLVRVEGDEGTPPQNYRIDVSDNLGAGDSISKTIKGYKNITDIVTTNDEINSMLTVIKFLQDFVEAADNVARSTKVGLYDGIPMDEGSKVGEMSAAVTDTLTFIDNKATTRLSMVSLLDTISPDDSTTMAHVINHVEDIEVEDSKTQQVIKGVIDSLDPSDTIQVGVRKLLSLVDSVSFWTSVSSTQGKTTPKTNAIFVSLSVDRELERSLHVRSSEAVKLDISTRLNTNLKMLGGAWNDSERE